MNFKNRYTQTIAAVSISLLLMMGVRFFLLFSYPEDFANLTNTELMLSLFSGLRVDIITLFTFLGLFILLLTLPIPAVHAKGYRKTIAILWNIVLISILAICIGDVLYYDFSHRHISNEIFNLAEDTDVITSMAFNSHFNYTLGSTFLFTAIFWFYAKLFSAPIRNQDISQKSWIALLAIVLILFAGIRNSVESKSFGISDSYAVNKTSSGNLALNGFFSLYRTAGDFKSEKRHKLMKLNSAITITTKLLHSDKAPFVSHEIPLARSFHENKSPNYNVVIVLLESWGAEHIDGFTRYTELGVTPYFKRLSNEGLAFTNFYANGYRSANGITSIFTGITLPSGFQYLGSGLELSNLSYLAKIAKQNGYRTISMQGSNRRSFRIDAVSKLTGFDEYYGAEDMPNVETVEAGRKPQTGTYDYNLFHFMHHKLNGVNHPFLAFMFTSTNHTDYYLPHSKFERYPHTLSDQYGRLNSLIYVDNAIERFMEGVKKEPWFDNTIFIFTADHGSGDALDPIGKSLRPNDKPLPKIEHFRIPLVIYAPKIFKAQHLDTIGSQNDIFPTIMDILGFKQPFSTMGNSLLDASVSSRFVYLFGGSQIGYISKKGYIMHNYKTVVEAQGTPQSIRQMEQELFAVDSTLSGLLDQNKWAK